jgi:hypothetical protein
MKPYVGPAILMAAIGIITLGATVSSTRYSYGTSGTSCPFDKQSCHYWNKNQKIYDNSMALIRAERDRDLKDCEMENEGASDQHLSRAKECFVRHGWEWTGGPDFMSAYNRVVRPKNSAQMDWR